MSKGKYERKGRHRRTFGSKAMALMLACVLLIGGVVGGTVAWLTANTVSVENTFTATDIEVTLVETKGLNEQKEWENKMIPGATYEKDPTVTVTDKTTVDCYLFVKFEESANASTYLTYTSNLTEANGWTKLNGEDNVWYRIVKTTDGTKSWKLLKDDKVTVNAENVTKENMSTAAQTKLTYTAYAVQLLGFESDPAGAWEKVNAK